MNQKHITKWETTREKGIIRFVIFRGVLAWGLPMFLIMTFFVNRGSMESVTRLSFSALIYGIGGIFFGLWMWKASEKAFQSAMNRNGSE